MNFSILLPLLPGGQVGNNKQDKQTNRALIARREQNSMLQRNSFRMEIFSFGEIFRLKDFFKNCGPYCIRGPN